jgi:hypothetical protein
MHAIPSAITGHCCPCSARRNELDIALADNLTLSAEVAWLTAELAATRLDRANLLAAMRAAIAAHADGESDPLSYLRDEVDARQLPAQLHGRAS